MFQYFIKGLFTVMKVNLIKDGSILGSAVVAGGVPEDLQRSILQVITGLVVWLTTRLLERIGKK